MPPAIMLRVAFQPQVCADVQLARRVVSVDATTRMELMLRVGSR